MADPREPVDREEFLQRAAAETREPDEARRMRSGGGDDRSRRDDGASLAETADALAQTRDRLRDTGSELEERQRELGRSAQMADEVAERAAALRADTVRTAEAGRAIPAAGREDREEAGED